MARPFDKFFNWGEGGRTTDASVIAASGKLDGSLGIGYVWRDRWPGATRGRFDGDQAAWATAFLDRHYDLRQWPAALTPLWEIIASLK
jgi:hypothetical protein